MFSSPSVVRLFALGTVRLFKLRIYNMYDIAQMRKLHFHTMFWYENYRNNALGILQCGCEELVVDVKWIQLAQDWVSNGLLCS